jgi:hypothetical protein
MLKKNDLKKLKKIHAKEAEEPAESQPTIQDAIDVTLLLSHQISDLQGQVREQSKKLEIALLQLKLHHVERCTSRSCEHGFGQSFDAVSRNSFV